MWRRACRMGASYLSRKQSTQLPGANQTRTKFGDFDRAVVAAQRWADDNPPTSDSPEDR